VKKRGGGNKKTGNKKLKHKKMANKKTIKEEEPKIKVLAYELLPSTFSYLMLTPWYYSNPSNLSSANTFP
jgi:hypothetical protein